MESSSIHPWGVMEAAEGQGGPSQAAELKASSWLWTSLSKGSGQLATGWGSVGVAGKVGKGQLAAQNIPGQAEGLTVNVHPVPELG